LVKKCSSQNYTVSSLLSVHVTWCLHYFHLHRPMQVNPCHHYLILRVVPSLIFFFYYFVLYLLKSLVSSISRVPQQQQPSLFFFFFLMVMASGYNEIDSITWGLIWRELRYIRIRGKEPYLLAIFFFFCMSNLPLIDFTDRYRPSIPRPSKTNWSPLKVIY